MKLKLLFLVPHLSTGGMPQFVLKRIEHLQKFKNEIEVFLVEYSQFSDTYIVQRNKIIELLDVGHFHTLGGTTETERKNELIDIIKNNNIDIVHFEEISEGFEGFNRIPIDLLNNIFTNERTYKIVETCHNVWFNPDNRKLTPDAYCLVTPFHVEQTFKNQKSYKELITYPYEDKVTEIKSSNNILSEEHVVPTVEKVKMREKLGIDLFKTHVMNVGLWTEGKNQKEGVEVARIIWKKNKDIHFHFIGNQAPNFKNYWGPIMNNLPPNVTVWGERDDVDDFMKACDVMMFNSTWECNPLVLRESVNYGMKIIARNLPQYVGMFDNYIFNIEGDFDNISETLLTVIESKETYKIEPEECFGDKMFKFYKKVLNSVEKCINNKIENDYSFFNHYVINPYLEINGSTLNDLNIRFYDNQKLSYESNVPINSWVKMNKEYYTDWKIEVRENNKLIYETTNNYENKRVYISLGSKSLGDTMAWVPYCEEFRIKHNCKLIVSTFMNELFVDQYPNIEFVEPGKSVNNIVAQYRLGWFYDKDGGYDKNKHPYDFKKIPLQKTATDILGLTYEEIRPKLNIPNKVKRKKVGLGLHSTAQAKYWNNPSGWQEVVDYLNNLGYECMIYSKEGDGYMGNSHPKSVTTFKGGSIQDVIDDLSECEFFIGLGSGLSWLAWACKLPVVLISGFSERWAETKLDTYRVINENVCHGCFNYERLDAGDWNWCPLHKGTDRQFECSKQITSDMVIKEIDKILDNNVITIILSHANTEEKKNILVNNLKSIKTQVLLSTNYPIDGEIKSLCNFINYENENPILLKEEFDKYNSYFYFVSDENGKNVSKYFDYEHGFAVYKLVFGGLKLAKSKGFEYAHIINYDYIIDDETIKENKGLLEYYDAVFYKYKQKSYQQDSYSTGFFSGKIEKLFEVFSYYNSKNEYYNFDDYFKILEIITYDVIKKLNLNVKELYYEDLKDTCVLDSVTDSHIFLENVEENEFKKISDSYGCDKTSKHSYHNVYTKIFENIRNKEFSLLEIGIDEGKSLNVWCEYLKNAKIYGLDINREFSHNKGYVFKGDQNKLSDLEKITLRIKNCKIIVDDGSHNPQHQIKTFSYLFEHLLENGGYYIIEDVETSYWDPSSELYGYEIGYLNTVDYFLKLVHNVNYNYNNEKNILSIESISFEPNCIVIKKL